MSRTSGISHLPYSYDSGGHMTRVPPSISLGRVKLSSTSYSTTSELATTFLCMQLYIPYTSIHPLRIGTNLEYVPSNVKCKAESHYNPKIFSSLGLLSRLCDRMLPPLPVQDTASCMLRVPGSWILPPLALPAAVYIRRPVSLEGVGQAINANASLVDGSREISFNTPNVSSRAKGRLMTLTPCEGIELAHRGTEAMVTRKFPPLPSTLIS